MPWPRGIKEPLPGSTENSSNHTRRVSTRSSRKMRVLWRRDLRGGLRLGIKRGPSACPVSLQSDAAFLASGRGSPRYESDTEMSAYLTLQMCT